MMQVVSEHDSIYQRSASNLTGNSRSWSSLIAQCLFSRLTCLSCLVFITFLICITQEFTYILNFNGYVATTNLMHEQPIRLFSRRVMRKFVNARKSIKGRVTNDEELDDWRRITDNIYLYSAFWDNRSQNESVVRIIVGAKIGNDSLSKLKCLLLKSSTSLYEEVVSTHKVLIEHHFQQSRTIYVLCTVPSRDPPSMVSLVPSEWNSSWKSNPIWVKVHLLQGKQEASGIGVCVRPLFNYTDTFRIVEFIAYYEALGVTHFTFYNHDSVEGVATLIRHLQDINYSVQLLPWSLPSEIKDMWSLGQIASINDCIYRGMATNSHIAVVDLDEFITPRHVMAIQGLLLALEKNGRRTGSFVFRSCVFCSEYKLDVLPDYIAPFITQTSVRRENKIYPFLVRTKYVVKPSEVLAAGVHHVWELLPGAEERFVPASQALVHHYRAHLCLGGANGLETGEIDPMSRKYLNRLLRSEILEIWKRIMQNSDEFS